MQKTYSEGSEKIARYVEDLFQPEDSVLRDVRARSEAAGLPRIQVGTLDGLHLETIARSVRAKKIVEIGTLGGYSGIHLARALAPGGRLYTCELEPVNAEVARESFRRAGVADRVEVLVGPALESLRKLTTSGPFDLVFIDADKTNYPGYLKWAAENLAVGGVVLGDNTFAWGMIADEKIDDPEDQLAVRALREFNHELAQGGRFQSTLLPTGEGLTFGVKIK